MVLVKGSIFASSNQNNTMTRIQNTHNTIKAKMANKTTAELIVVAQLARVQKSDEAMRMVYALTMDVIMSRVSEEEYELIESLMN